jgi:hypothetical protein
MNQNLLAIGLRLQRELAESVLHHHVVDVLLGEAFDDFVAVQGIAVHPDLSYMLLSARRFRTDRSTVAIFVTHEHLPSSPGVRSSTRSTVRSTWRNTTTTNGSPHGMAESCASRADAEWAASVRP